MKLYDFDKDYNKFMKAWLKTASKQYKRVEELEEHAAEQYENWMSAPADFLDGEAPNAFFKKYDDPNMLISWLCEYEEGEVAVPDQLLDRITELGDKAVEPLLDCLKSQSCGYSVKVTAINLLKEIDDPRPNQAILDIILNSDTADEITECCAEYLQTAGKSLLDQMISGYDTASPDIKKILLDVMCGFGSNDKVFELAVNALLTEPDNRALNAANLEKLGNYKAIRHLRKVAECDDINYLDFIEVKNAIEALGGEFTSQKDFSGDPYYESLKNL